MKRAMRIRGRSRSIVPAAITMIVGLALASPGSAQAEPPVGEAPSRRIEDGRFLTITFEGFVSAPDGSPAEGAVVVSSAGGRAVADARGSYRLEAHVPPEARSVQVTAVGRGGRNVIASTSVALSPASPRSASGTMWVGVLSLTPGLTCLPSWLPTFGDAPGVGYYNARVSAAAVFDDGSGPALYVGGTFPYAGGVVANSIAKWDGSRWAALDGGIEGGVRALVVYDDGGGPALYAAGHLSRAGDLDVQGIAKWDGSSWSALGDGIPTAGSLDITVNALTVYDDGNGPALYAGGNFTSAGGASVNGIAKWDGSSWASLGSGIVGMFGVLALSVYDDGAGPALYAGGDFTAAGGVAAKNIAKWDGSSWTPLGGGITAGSLVLALTVYDDGGGPGLYAGGSFTSAGGVPASNIAKWDGAAWTALGGGRSLGVSALTVYDGGNGLALHAGSISHNDQGNCIARWDGSTWAALGSGVPAPYQAVYSLTVYDDDGGPALCVGGGFATAGGLRVGNVAAWDGSNWKKLGWGIDVDGTVLSLATYDDGSGPGLYAGGYIRTAGGVVVNGVSMWDGSSWGPVGTGVNGSPGYINAMTEFGGELYVAGSFTSAGGVTANNIARWNGSSWSPLSWALGNGVWSTAGASSYVYSLAVYDDGGGPALYVGGTFNRAGGVASNCIARWEGSSWSALGSGLDSIVAALAVYDDGGGPALYAGGHFFTAGGVAANRIARWNGSSWAAVGSGMSGSSWYNVAALAVYDDGGGPALYAGGYFPSAGGVPANNVAKWNGSTWAALGDGLQGASPDVLSLSVYDDGGGPALYAGGNFQIAGGIAVNHITKWDGSTWSALGRGVEASGSYASVKALTVYDDGNGSALCAGGNFYSCPDSGDSFVARWTCVPDTSPPTLSCPSSVFKADHYNSPPGEIVTFSVMAMDDVDPSPGVVCVPPSGSFFPSGTTLVTCTATDASGNQSTCEFPVTVRPKLQVRR